MRRGGFVIPAEAGIQVYSLPSSLDTRFRGYDESFIVTFRVLAEQKPQSSK